MEELRFVKKIASIAVVGMGAVFFVIVILVSKYIPDVFWNADGLPGLFWNRDGSQCGFIFVHRTGKVPYFLFECDTSGEKSNAAYLW